MTDGAMLSHSKSQLVTREQLAEYIPPPSTETFKAVSHKELVDTLLGVMQDRGLFVTREQYAVQGAKLFGTFDVEWMQMQEYGAAIGFRHENRVMSIQLACGVRVFVCDNMSFSGEMIHTRKHTSKLNLGEELDRAMYRYMQGFRRLLDDIHVQENTPVDNARGQSLIYDIFRQKIVPLRFFHPICEAWEHWAPPRSAWTLHNVFTGHIKHMPPAPAFRATARLGKFFASKF